MYRIGCVGIDTSHPTAFLGVLRDKGMNMQYTAVFNDGFRSDEEVEQFMEEAGIETRSRSLEHLAEEVDIGFIHDCNWDRHLHLAAPFIAAGKPVFIDKPIVGNLADCEALERLVAAGAIILGGSSLRHAYEVVELRQTLAQTGEQALSVLGTCGVDEFNYGIHIVEALHSLMGSGAQSVRYLGHSSTTNAPIEQYLIEWPDQSRAIYQLQTGPWQPCHLLAQTQQAIHHRPIDITKVYEAVLFRIQEFLAGGLLPSPIEELTEAIRICLAGKASKDHSGKPVRLDELSVYNPHFDGQMFQHQYAAANPPPSLTPTP